MDNLFQSACVMVNDKFNITDFSRNKFDEIVNEIITNNPNISTNDINRNILIKIKEFYENQNSKIDNDQLNKKLKDYENQRKLNVVVNNVSQPINKSTNLETKNNQPIIYNNTNIINKSKTLIINSINREWFNNRMNNRNNIKVNISINLKDFELFPDCLCLSNNIRNITPYIIMKIADNIKSINYTFVCDKENEKWDIWRPSNIDCENINLINKSWNITLYDFMNNELNIGYDNIPIEKILKYNDKYYEIFFNNNDNDFSNNDLIKIKLYNSQLYDTKIKIDNNHYLIPSGNFKLEDFINATILNNMKQLIFIIKYSSI